MVKKGLQREMVNEGEGDSTSVVEDSDVYETVETEDDAIENLQTASGTENETEEELHTTMILRPRQTFRRPARGPVTVRKTVSKQKLTRKDTEQGETSRETANENGGIMVYLKQALQDMTGQIVTAIQATFTAASAPKAVLSSTHIEEDSQPNRTNKRKVLKKRSTRKNISQSRLNESPVENSSDECSNAYSDRDSDSINTSEIVKRKPRKQSSVNGRIPAYTGKEKWEVWVNRFEAVSRLQGWDETDKLEELLPRLQGSAGELVFDQLPQKYLDSYPKLIRELTNRFGAHESKKNYRSQFTRRNQRTDESPEAYAADLKRLYDKAYTNRDSRIRQEDLLQRFLSGLYDEKARIHVELNKEPCTIEEAVEDVIAYSEATESCKFTSDKSHIRQIKGNKDTNTQLGKLNGRKPEKTQIESKPEKEALRKEDIKEIFEELYKEKFRSQPRNDRFPVFNRGNNSYRPLQSSSSSVPNTQFNRQPPQGPSGIPNRSPIVCYKCGENGHIARRCEEIHNQEKYRYQGNDKNQTPKVRNAPINVTAGNNQNHSTSRTMPVSVPGFALN